MYKSEWHESANANYFLPIEHLFHYHDGLIKWALSACSKFPEMQQQLRNWDFKFLFHLDLEQAIVTLAGFAFPPGRRVGQYLQCPLSLNTLRFSEESCWTAADFPFQFTWRQRGWLAVLQSARLLFQKISVSHSCHQGTGWLTLSVLFFSSQTPIYQSTQDNGRTHHLAVTAVQKGGMAPQGQGHAKPHTHAQHAPRIPAAAPACPCCVRTPESLR